MEVDDPREILDRLIREHGENYGAMSRLIGRNPAYIQQFVKRGTPRKLDEADRRTLARYFGVSEELLGGLAQNVDGTSTTPSRRPAEASTPGLCVIPRLLLGASAGPGALDPDEREEGAFAFDARWLRAIGGRSDMLSIIRVDGESMAPTLVDGDDIMVDRSDGTARLRDGIYVLRLDDVLLVKRLALTPQRGHITIRSDNPLYPDFEDVALDDVVIVGRVVWTGRRVG